MKPAVINAGPKGKASRRDFFITAAVVSTITMPTADAVKMTGMTDCHVSTKPSKPISVASPSPSPTRRRMMGIGCGGVYHCAARRETENHRCPVDVHGFKICERNKQQALPNQQFKQQGKVPARAHPDEPHQ
ncbi:hypothetical protein CHS0354_018417 [Potamilus streckersoni]|uniref:Uncharacterized protein n=1 Tax=Potamilus streckersoni TaxID=2493646 RepID=A0AAE0W9A1_9BIVA|nr:hypothetical protein CHS0354_018417 [Potamilus streckersoni]